MATSQTVPKMPDLSLSYWVRGQSFDRWDFLEVSPDETIRTLQGLIVKQSPIISQCKPRSLKVYRVPIDRPIVEDDSPEHNLGSLTISMLGTPLQPWSVLSDIFTSLLPKDQLHLIIDPNNSEFLTVECWIRGGKPHDVFEVKLSTTSIGICELAIAIREASSQARGGGWQLYEIFVNEEAELRKYLSAPGSGRLLEWTNLNRTIFNDVPFSSVPRVVVEPRSASSLTGPAAGVKRERLEDPLEANKRIRLHLAALPIQTPPAIATPSNFQKHYEKRHEPYIRCGRPRENHSPFPLVLAHRIFAIFVSECETYQPSDEDFKFISKLSQCMCRFFEDERERGMLFRACMREYGINLMEAKIEGTDYMTEGDARVGVLPYLVSEAKKTFGASKGDPYIQAAAYHLAATQSWLSRHPGDPIALPCMHIFYNGPVLGFAGSMVTDQFDVNVLGSILPLFYHRTDIDMQIRCAKMFGALKNSATALKEYYNHIPSSPPNTSFPWITQYDTITLPTETREYKYLRPMDGGKFLYICQHIHDEKQILVKFVQTYSKEAHLASAAEDGAPILLGHCDVLSCGWSVVVMELLEEPHWISGLKIVDQAEQRMVYREVKEHVLTLHEKGFVHGDIRPQNLLVKRPGSGNLHTLSVRLIDFDWAGEINKAKYPFLVNPDLGYGFRRPSSVKGGGIITTEHDLAMVDLMYPYAGL